MKKLQFNLIKFIPKETPNDYCIWCEKSGLKNQAHILSKQLLRTNLKSNILKTTVCEHCNSAFGKNIEDWFLKFSPIATWRHVCFGDSLSLPKNLKNLPNFMWSEGVNEWLIINRDETLKFIGSQMILTKINETILVHLTGSDSEDERIVLSVENSFKIAVQQGHYTIDIQNSLPENFNPRIYMYKEKFILVARSVDDSSRLIAHLTPTKLNPPDFELAYVDNLNFSSRRIHYKWSYSKYLKWSSKIAFEFLSLVEGSAFVMDSKYKKFKTSMIDSRSYVSDDIHIIPYLENKGYQVNRLSPAGWVSMFFSAKTYDIKLPIFETTNANAHKIFIHELQGLLICTIKIFNVEICQIIIAENIKLDKIYYVEYDFVNDELNFYYTMKNVFNVEKFDKVKGLNVNKQTMTLATVELSDEMRNLFK